MNTFRQWLASQMEMSLMRAEARHIRRYFTENLFLLGIEIGMGRRLSLTERTMLLKTYITAETLVSVQRHIRSVDIEQSFQFSVSSAVKHWLDEEPRLRACLEETANRSLEDLNNGGVIPIDLRLTLKKEMKDLAASCCEYLSAEQIEAIIQQIENPLDRA